MKTTAASVLGFACAILLLGPALAFSQDRPALPPPNPFLIQNSVYPSVHFDPAHGVTPLGWTRTERIIDQAAWRRLMFSNCTGLR